jgi:hypothetical protein
MVGYFLISCATIRVSRRASIYGIRTQQHAYLPPNAYGTSEFEIMAKKSEIRIV